MWSASAVKESDYFSSFPNKYETIKVWLAVVKVGGYWFIKICRIGQVNTAARLQYASYIIWLWYLRTSSIVTGTTPLSRLDRE